MVVEQGKEEEEEQGGGVGGGGGRGGRGGGKSGSSGVVSSICGPMEVKECLFVISRDMKKTGDQPTNQPMNQPMNSFLYRCVDPSKMDPSLLK